jgi:hypothetical protein
VVVVAELSRVGDHCVVVQKEGTPKTSQLEDIDFFLIEAITHYPSLRGGSHYLSLPPALALHTR